MQAAAKLNIYQKLNHEIAFSEFWIIHQITDKQRERTLKDQAIELCTVQTLIHRVKIFMIYFDTGPLRLSSLF